MDATFRMRRWYRNLGVAVGLEFLALGALGVYEALTEPSVKHRAVAAAMSGGIALVMPGLLLWMLVSYRRHELTVRGDRVTLRGIMQRREIDLREVTEARWLTRPVGGSLVLRSGSTRIPIHFANYESEESARIIHHLRSMLSPVVQSGWNLFAYKVASPEGRSVRRKPGPNEFLIRRDRWDRYLVAFLPVTGLIGIIGWWSTGELGFLFAPSIPPLLGWALMRSSTPADGMFVPRLLTPDTSGFLGFLLLWFLVAIAGIAAHAVFRPRLAHPDAFAIVGAAIWFGALMFEAALQGLPPGPPRPRGRRPGGEGSRRSRRQYLADRLTNTYDITANGGSRYTLVIPIA